MRRLSEEDEKKVKMHPIKSVLCSVGCRLGRIGIGKPLEWLFNQIRITLHFSKTPIQENFRISSVYKLFKAHILTFS